MEKANIILTGFMATGKTTVGKLLAKEFGYEFIDTDKLIEARTGKSVSQIFDQLGETAFRRMEAALARELATRQRLVIATGGRLMLDAGNAAELSKSGRVFCLVATPEDILQRVAEDEGVHRPLLEVPHPAERVVALLEQRAEGYGRFPQMMTSTKSPEEVARILSALIRARPDQRIPIAAEGAGYEFIVGGGILPFATQLGGVAGPVAIVTDNRVGPLYAASIGTDCIRVEVAVDGRHKSLDTVAQVYDRLLAADFDRSGTIVALGGAAICELAGFVSATYMRGVDCILCPTSLLAMADTAIGGKTGVDLPEGRNLVGAFKQPKAVIADVATLQTQPAEAVASGIAEIIKHGLIADPALFEQIESSRWQNAPNGLPPLGKLQNLVARSIRVKIRIVHQDPFDRGPRHVLNLGHTFAHAIEQVSSGSTSHGRAVAIGLTAAARLSCRLGYCPAALTERIESVIAAQGLPIDLPVSLGPRRLVDAMARDKKTTDGRIRFVLLRDIGDVFVTDTVKLTDVMKTLEELAR